MSSVAPASLPPIVTDLPCLTGADAAVFAGAFQTAPDPLLIVAAASGNVLAANSAFLELAAMTVPPTGGEPLSALPLFRGQPTLCAACLALRPGDPNLEQLLTVSDATNAPRTVALTASAFASEGRILVQCRFADLTGHQWHERRERQSAKMQALRQQTGLLAHDFNNTLTCVRGYVSIALESPHLSTELRDILGHVKAASTRATEFTHRLLGFSRHHKLHLQPVDMEPFLNQLAGPLRTALPPGVQIKVAACEPAVHLAADPEALRQAVELLVKNAREACGEHGEITLAAAHCHPPRSAGTTAQPLACISVHDNGCGMSPAVQSRLFEPGFTTKKSGGSSGISLAKVYSIVADHGGWIDVQSAAGHGSTFSIMLPLAPAA